MMKNRLFRNTCMLAALSVAAASCADDEFAKGGKLSDGAIGFGTSAVTAGDGKNVRIFLRKFSQKLRARVQAFSRPLCARQQSRMAVCRLGIDDRLFRDLLLADRHGDPLCAEHACKAAFACVASAHAKAAIMKQEREICVMCEMILVT